MIGIAAWALSAFLLGSTVDLSNASAAGFVEAPRLRISPEGDVSLTAPEPMRKLKAPSLPFTLLINPLFIRTCHLKRDQSNGREPIGLTGLTGLIGELERDFANGAMIDRAMNTLDPQWRPHLRPARPTVILDSFGAQRGVYRAYTKFNYPSPGETTTWVDCSSIADDQIRSVIAHELVHTWASVEGFDQLGGTASPWLAELLAVIIEDATGGASTIDEWVQTYTKLPSKAYLSTRLFGNAPVTRIEDYGAVGFVGREIVTHNKMADLRTWIERTRRDPHVRFESAFAAWKALANDIGINAPELSPP